MVQGSDASRRPRRMPRTTTPEIVDRLLGMRRRHPTWGAGKLRDHLVTLGPATPWPCRDTIHTIFVRAGAVRQRRQRRVVAPLLVTRVLEVLLFGTTPTDPLTYAAAALLFTTVAAIASTVPALRAVAIDPAITLRAE